MGAGSGRVTKWREQGNRADKGLRLLLTGRCHQDIAPHAGGWRLDSSFSLISLGGSLSGWLSISIGLGLLLQAWANRTAWFKHLESLHHKARGRRRGRERERGERERRGAREEELCCLVTLDWRLVASNLGALPRGGSKKAREQVQK